MHRFVSQEEITQTLPELGDSVSYAKGDQTGLTYCGPRTIGTITPVSIFQNFLSINTATREITLESDSADDVGVYTITFIYFLSMYASAQTQATFTVTVEVCDVTDFTFDTPDPFVYEILDVPLIFQIDDFG